MKLDVLKALHKTIAREQLCEAYESATGEKINLELVDQLIKPKKKQSILTIEKELLSSYIEAVSDLKRIREELIDEAETEGVSSYIEPIITKMIDKHTQRIKDSGIWE